MALNCLCNQSDNAAVIMQPHSEKYARQGNTYSNSTDKPKFEFVEGRRASSACKTRRRLLILPSSLPLSLCESLDSCIKGGVAAAGTRLAIDPDNRPTQTSSCTFGPRKLIDCNSSAESLKDPTRRAHYRTRVHDAPLEMEGSTGLH